MRTSIFLLAFLIALSAISCNRRAYVAEDFEQRTQDHLSIAVIPFDVLNTGRRTKQMTDEFMAEQRIWEAEAFQQDLVDRIMHRATRNRKLVVDMQATTETNSLLQDACVEIVDAHSLSAKDLTRLLDVDAVVMAYVKKNKVLTEVESAAASVLAAVLNNPVSNSTNSQLNRTYEIDMRVSVLDTEGTTLYNDAASIDIDFGLTADEAISRVNRRLVRKFPYIEKK